MKIPTLTKLSETSNRTTWRAEFVDVPTGQATTYLVTTYPNGNLLEVKSWSGRRVVRGTRLLEQIRMGLKHAETAA